MHDKVRDAIGIGVSDNGTVVLIVVVDDLVCWVVLDVLLYKLLVEWYAGVRVLLAVLYMGYHKPRSVLRLLKYRS